MRRLTTRLGRIVLTNPVTVASGTFGLEYADFFDLNRLGAYVTKTITLHPKEGNPPPRLYETESGLLNSIGLQNPGLDAFIDDHLPLLRKHLSIPIIVSFSASSVREFTEILRRLEDEADISGYEINISCPNVEKEGIAFGVDPLAVAELTHSLSTLTQRELIIKLTPNVTDIAAIAQAAEDNGATSLALINTLTGMAIDFRNGKSFIKRGIAGYSGIGIKPVALACVYKTAQAVNLPILAMGGIHTWQDALEFFYAGASAIAIGTASFIEPDAPIQCLEGLQNWFQQHDMILPEIIGKVSF